jgi:alcohol dehydrogenase class IV
MEKNILMMTKASVFTTPGKIIFGNGAASEAGKEAKKLGAKKALVVTDQGVIKAGLVNAIEESLKDQKVAFGVFDQVAAEPQAQIVDECAQVVKGKSYDIIIGIGGGSSLDVAKGASVMATNKGKILDYIGVDMVPHHGLPKILLPTTAGTGSEVTRTIVATDEVQKIKQALRSDFLMADVSIIDPLLTISMPPVVTADTGVDALVHAIEAYVSIEASPFSDALAIEAIQLIADNLPTAYAKASNMEARFNMSLGATLAGIAFNNGGLGAVHALSNALGVEYHLTHGRSNAAMLPYVVEYNKIGNLKKYARIAQAMGEKIEGLTLYQAAEKLVSCLNRFLEVLNIPNKLSAYGISEKDIPKLVQGGMKRRALFAQNPRDLKEDDVRKIYTSAL